MDKPSPNGPMLGFLKGEAMKSLSAEVKSNRIGFNQNKHSVNDSTVAPKEDLPILYAPAEGHGMVIAGTGAGKGRSVAIPMLLTCENPMVVLVLKRKCLMVSRFD